MIKGENNREYNKFLKEMETETNNNWSNFSFKKNSSSKETRTLMKSKL